MAKPLSGHRIKININSTVEDKLELDRPLITILPIDCMQLGYAYTNATRRKVRCVRWRQQGICRYILLGFDRGRILPVMRSFQKIRPLTENERKRVLISAKVWDHLM